MDTVTITLDRRHATALDELIKVGFYGGDCTEAATRLMDAGILAAFSGRTIYFSGWPPEVLTQDGVKF